MSIDPVGLNTKRILVDLRYKERLSKTTEITESGLLIDINIYREKFVVVTCWGSLICG